MKNKYKTIKRLDDCKRRGVSLMTDIKLKFPEIDQTYAFLDLQTIQIRGRLDKLLVIL